MASLAINEQYHMFVTTVCVFTFHNGINEVYNCILSRKPITLIYLSKSTSGKGVGSLAIIKICHLGCFDGVRVFGVLLLRFIDERNPFFFAFADRRLALPGVALAAVLTSA